MKIKVSESEVREIIRKELIKEQESIEDADDFWTGAAGTEDLPTLGWGALAGALAGAVAFFAYKRFAPNAELRLGAATWLDNVAAVQGRAPILKLIPRSAAIAIAPRASGIAKPRMTWRALAEEMVDHDMRIANRSTGTGAEVTNINQGQRQTQIRELLASWEQSGRVQVNSSFANLESIGVNTTNNPAWASARPSTTPSTGGTYVGQVPGRTTNIVIDGPRPGNRATAPGKDPGTGAWIKDTVPNSFWDDMGLNAARADAIPRSAGSWTVGRVAGARAGMAALVAEAQETMTGVQPFRQLGRTILSPVDAFDFVDIDTLQATVLGDPESYISFIEGLNQSSLFSGTLEGSFSCGGLLVGKDITGADTTYVGNWEALKSRWERAIEIIGDSGAFDLARIMQSEFRPAMSQIMSDIRNLEQGYTVYDLCKLSVDIEPGVRRNAIVALRDVYGDIAMAWEVGDNPSAQINNFLVGVYSDFVVRVAAGANRGDVILYNPTPSAESMDTSSDTVTGVSAAIEDRDVVDADYVDSEGAMRVEGVRLRQTSIIEKLTSSQAFSTIKETLMLAGAITEVECPDAASEEIVTMCVAQATLPASEFERMFRADDPQTPGDESREMRRPYSGAIPIPPDETAAEAEDVVISGEMQQITTGRPGPESRSIQELFNIFSEGRREGSFPNLILNDMGFDWMTRNFDRWYGRIQGKAPFIVLEQYANDEGGWYDSTGTSNFKELVKHRLLTPLDIQVGGMPEAGNYPLGGTLAANYNEIQNINNYLVFPRILIAMDNDLALSDYPISLSGDDLNWAEFYGRGNRGSGELRGEDLGEIAMNEGHEHQQLARGQQLKYYVSRYVRTYSGATPWYPQLATWMRDKWS